MSPCRKEALSTTDKLRGFVDYRCCFVREDTRILGTMQRVGSMLYPKMRDCVKDSCSQGEVAYLEYLRPGFLVYTYSL